MLHDVIEALRRKAPEAMALARAEVEAAPESADAHHLLGLAQREAGDLPGARASFERAIELAPDESIYHFSSALLAHADGDTAAADRASARAIALDPNQLGAYLLRIQLALAARDAGEADRQLGLAEKIAPGLPQLAVAAGQIALAKGDAQRAVDQFVRAAAELPQDVQVLVLLATAYRRQGHPAFAEQALRRALAVDPSRADVRLDLVGSLLAQERPDDAEAELAQWRSMNPGDPNLAYAAAELKQRAGDARGALALYREALAAAPNHWPATLGAERALIAIGDRALARQVWEEIVAGNPHADPIWASLMSVTDDPDGQEDVMRRWREAIPGSPAAALNQARYDEAAGRDAEAEAGYDYVLHRVPNHPDAMFGKAVYELRRDPDAGIERLGTMAMTAPPELSRPALAVRGQAHDRMDRFAEAALDWRQAQLGLGAPLPALPPPDPALQALAQPAPPASGDDPVVLLWGPPGSGSERLAAALRFAPGRPLLLEAPVLLPRVLDFPDTLLARATNAADMPALAAEIRGEYVRTLQPLLARGNLGVFDWLARFDARVVPAMREALPRLRLVAVLRDPRDLLLNWLAFSAPAGPSFADPLESAAWLANQLEHLLFARDALGLPVLVVDMDRFDAEPDATMAKLAAFADLASPPDTRVALERRTGPGKLPTLLPEGRWHAYGYVLEAAFELLGPVAERLGYPRG